MGAAPAVYGSRPGKRRRAPQARKRVNVKRRFIVSFLLACVALWTACVLHARQGVPGTPYDLEVTPWEEAAALFRTDPRWLGGDGATSVDLGNDRTLWLFGDSLVDLQGSGSRRNACLVRNTVAVQEGRLSAPAKMTFYWKVLGNRPRPFFAGENGDWFWPGSGSRVGTGLVVFLVRVRLSDNPLGFEAAGWKAVFVPNADAEPTLWAQRKVFDEPGSRVLVGSACCLVTDGYLYAFGSDVAGGRAYAARWPVSRAAVGDLSAPEWWMGPGIGWTSAPRRTRGPAPVFTGAQSEFSIHFVPDLKGYLAVQTISMTDRRVGVRYAPAIDRAWSDPAGVYAPPECADRTLFVYAAKAHTAFDGTWGAITYAVNTLDESRLLSDMNIYYPRVLKVTLCTAAQDRPGMGNERTDQ